MLANLLLAYIFVDGLSQRSSMTEARLTRVTHVTNMKSTSTSTSAVAIPAINAKDSTFNLVGGNQTNITINYNIDPNCDQGIGPIKHTISIELIICLDKVYQWLSAVIPSTNYHGALKVRLQDTGLWFINGARFARWKGAADDFLWICGTRMCSYRLQVIMILNRYCSWYRKDRLEVNLFKIALFYR